jgi:uncharacterized membrane protein
MKIAHVARLNRLDRAVGSARRGALMFAAFAIAATVAVAAPREARADLRFCNQTSKDAQVIEGHQTPKNGLVVQGTFPVRAGTCGVIVPGTLQARRYYLRVISNGEGYGSTANHLCVYDLAHFTIDGEDAPSFRCSGSVMPSNIHIAGFTNESMHLAEFMEINTNGEANAVLTQLKTLGFRYQLK